MLNSAQKQRIVDRFQKDAEALLDPNNTITPGGRQASIGDLWSQVLDARKRYLSVPISTLVANSTNTIRIAGIGRGETVTGARIAFGAVPASVGGTVLATLRHRAGVGGAVDASGTSIDLETLCTAANTAYALTMAAVASRRLVAGEVLYIDIVSNNGDMTAGTGGVITVELEPTEV